MSYQSPYASGAIFTDAKGVPVERPEPLEPGAPYAEWLVHTRAVNAYNDRVTDMGNSSFAEAFSAAVKR